VFETDADSSRTSEYSHETDQQDPAPVHRVQLVHPVIFQVMGYEHQQSNIPMPNLGTKNKSLCFDARLLRKAPTIPDRRQAGLVLRWCFPCQL
jgi:hypothetical protein